MRKQNALIAFLAVIVLALFTINLRYIAPTPAHAEASTNNTHDTVFFVGKTTYQADGKTVTMDAAPYTANDRTYVPVRYLAEALGMTVEWNKASQTVSLKGKKEIKLVVNSKTMLVNGNPTKMDVAPVIYKGRTMLPARWVAEAEGYKVYWFEKLKTVHVWPVVYFEGGWRVPKENIHPITTYMKIYMNHKDAAVETIAGKYTVKDAFSVPYDTFRVPFQEMLRIYGFPVDYNLTEKSNTLILYGGRWKAKMAIGDEKIFEAEQWTESFSNEYWVDHKKPYRAPNGSWMVQHGVELYFEDMLFGTGCDITDAIDSGGEYTEFIVDTNPD
ncbi:hypothetical protein DCCM_3219 [Desulfocucumis palustris]|uniref:Copper amine oxidase-like N-terminal domain-containing protein n=1 Tax=Desulfocucumis palustris TaxID=1898651 RepID=A0A2L2XCP1_9FIRM|nr:copper amine oxidase N-terminal domain-containing protein [Desulfocucumis palustris]GBF34107.1 hypothetical protein DCCM_3219 [Desulfocucumis palustris]